jgi:hypothetical protein
MKIDFINVSDVITAVSFARENDLLLAVRGNATCHTTEITKTDGR